VNQLRDEAYELLRNGAVEDAYAKAERASILANSFAMQEQGGHAPVSYTKLLVVLATTCLQTSRYDAALQAASTTIRPHGGKAATAAMQVLQGEALYHLNRITETLAKYQVVDWGFATTFVDQLIMAPAAQHKHELEG
jgi:hypothetical protein